MATYSKISSAFNTLTSLPCPNSPPFTSAFIFPNVSCFRFLWPHDRPVTVTARSTVVSSTPLGDLSDVYNRHVNASKKLLLDVKDLIAVEVESKLQILNGVSLSIYEGEVHAIMGKNGSGKSTFAKVLVGHPGYRVAGGSVTFKGKNLLEMDPEERSLSGLFMSFQSPVEIPGVSNIDFLNMAYNARRKKAGLPELGPLEFYGYISSKLELVKMAPEFLNRNVNEGFSGGEKKRNEILQLAVLGADMAILDEVDSGLDVDALEEISRAVNGVRAHDKSMVLITHYLRLLELIEPEFVHVMEKGRIVRTGDISIAKLLEKDGFTAISSM